VKTKSRITANGKKVERKGMKNKRTSLVRASVSFPPDLYQTLEEIAKQKKVSLPWVVRDPAERYVAHENGRGGKGQTQAAHGVGGGYNLRLKYPPEIRFEGKTIRFPLRCRSSSEEE
jgi:hypothetical protein